MGVLVVRGRFAVFFGGHKLWCLRQLEAAPDAAHLRVGDEITVTELVFIGAVVRRSRPPDDVVTVPWLECVGTVVINEHGVALLSALVRS